LTGSSEEAGCVCAGIKRLKLSIPIMPLIRKLHLYFGGVFSGMGYSTVLYSSSLIIHDA